MKSTTTVRKAIWFFILSPIIGGLEYLTVVSVVKEWSILAVLNFAVNKINTLSGLRLFQLLIVRKI